MNKLLLLIGFVFSLFSYSQTFTGGSASILDYQSVEIPLTVSGVSPNAIDTVNFGVEQICINLTHTWVSDLAIALVAPDGTDILLFSSVGGDGDDMQGTCLNWDAANLLVNGAAPFTGTFKPPGQFGMVNNGQNPNGTWTLRIFDSYGGDEGILTDWSLTFGSNPAGYFELKESDLPIMVINTNGQSIADDPKIVADMGLIYNGPGNRNHIDDPKNEYNGKIGIEIRGNYSSSLPQKPYAFELVDENNVAVDSSLLGMPSENDWLLLANYNDKSFARNTLPYHLFEQMGNYATRNRFVDVIINGEYKGIYLLCEKIKRDSNRIDISKLEPTEISGQDVTGGYIVKIDYWDNSDSWQLEHSPIGFPGLDIHMVYYYPKAEDIVQEQKDYIQNFIAEFEDALYGPDFTDDSIGYRKYIDVSTFIDYFIINELTRNVDGYKKSRFFYKEKDHADGRYRKLKAGPVWDFDWAQKDMWGGSEDGSGFMYGDVNQDVHAPGWYIRLLQDTNFTNQLRCRYEDFRRNILSESYIHSKIDSVASVVEESQNWHFQTWGHLGAATGTPEVQAPSQTYAEEVQRLKDWYTRRLNWLDNNMPGTLNGCSMTGIETNKMSVDKIVSYPNPFHSQFTVSLSANSKGMHEIRLLDQKGRILRTGQLNSGELKYVFQDLQELENGIYLLEIDSEGETSVQKIIKL